MRLNSQAEYIREIENLLPKEAFAPASNKLLPLFAYLLALLALYFAFRLTEQAFFYGLLSLLLAHCLASLGFFAHDLSHRAILRKHQHRYPLEVLLFGVNLLPATYWDHLHNRTHHVHNNAVHKPVESPSHPEKSREGRWYDCLFLLSKKPGRWNPLLWLHFLAYLLGNYIAAIQAEQASQKERKASYSRKQKRRISIEAGVIVLLQVTIFFAVGANWWAYFWAGPVAYLLSFCILMAYIFTNHTIHSVNVLREVDDPLLTTISVEVHPVFNKLHLHFAYHTEHHLFPSLNSEYYPLVSSILKEKYPEKYNYVHLQEAWAALWQKYQEEVENRTGLKGSAG